MDTPITYEGCAGSATLLVRFDDHDGPPGGQVALASEFDLWRAGYIKKERLDGYVDDEDMELIEEQIEQECGA